MQQRGEYRNNETEEQINFVKNSTPIENADVIFEREVPGSIPMGSTVLDTDKDQKYGGHGDALLITKSTPEPLV